MDTDLPKRLNLVKPSISILVGDNMFEKVGEYLRDYLNSKILDPANRNKPWIYIGYPEIYSADYPRISIVQSGLVTMPVAIGSTKRFYEIIFDIDVWTKQTVIIDTTEYKPNRLKEYLADRVVYHLLSGRQELYEDYKFRDVIIRRATDHAVREEFRVYRKTITIGIVIDSDDYAIT